MYIFDDLEAYIENLIAFVADGVLFHHEVFVIERVDVWGRVWNGLVERWPPEQVTCVHFVDNYSFYQRQNAFHGETIVSYFSEILEPFLDRKLCIRTWAHVERNDEEGIAAKLEAFESVADQFTGDMRMLSVCAYDGSTPAALQTRLLRNHGYFMTDVELVASPLYPKGDMVTFPTLSGQSVIQSEVDYYKHKLDFVQVISHEVRNPLTIISAYARMVRDEELHLSHEGFRRISEIEDYVSVIDHELACIIQTEQMLSNDAYWNFETIPPLPVFKEVIDLMTVKAKVSGVRLINNIRLDENDRMIGNHIGVRLVVSNLLSNAIKYSNEQGTVECHVSKDNHNIQFIVKDHGVGMTQRQLNSLFKKYGKLNQNRSGQGIGLYIVKTLIDHLQGTILMDSVVGEGTTVQVTLPALET